MPVSSCIVQSVHPLVSCKSMLKNTHTQSVQECFFSVERSSNSNSSSVVGCFLHFVCLFASRALGVPLCFIMLDFVLQHLEFLRGYQGPHPGSLIPLNLSCGLILGCRLGLAVRFFHDEISWKESA